MLFQTHKESVGRDAWSTLYDAPVYDKEGASFLLLSPLRDGRSGSYRHIAVIETSNPKVAHPITLGKFEVEDILSWDQDNHRM